MEPDVTHHLFATRNRGSVVTRLARGRPGLDPTSSLPFPTAEALGGRMNAGSGPGKSLASEPAVAETVVGASRPHLNPSSVVSVRSGPGLSSLPFALVRASWLLRQLHPGQGEQRMQIPASLGCREGHMLPRRLARRGCCTGRVCAAPARVLALPPGHY